MEHLDDVLCKLSHLDLSGQIEDIHPTAKGLGASSEVFKGYWSTGNKYVAVKKLRIFLTKEERVVKKLAREAYIWSKLEHENVLPLLGFFIEGGDFPVLVSEWMARGTLQDYMPKLGRGMELVEMARGIAAGLTYLHGKGIIHSDLKSFNILISESGIPLLADFGLSYVLAATMSKMFETTTALDKGTVRWMAFELLSLSNDSVATPSEKTDVWAFGMTVYEMLKRDVPYSYLKNDPQVALAISRGKLPARPSPTEKAALPVSEQKLWDICTKCWMKKPAMRPSMHEILSDIAALQQGKSRERKINLNAALTVPPLTMRSVDDSRTKKADGKAGPSTSANGDFLCKWAMDPVSVPFAFKAHAIMEDWASAEDDPVSELFKHGYGWFAVFNPKVKRRLDVGLTHKLSHDSVVHCVRFSPDGKLLAVGCNRSARIYDVQTGAEICNLIDEHGRTQGDMHFLSVCFSPDGKYLVAGGEDEMIRVWDVAKIRINRVLEGHEGPVYGIAYSHNGIFFASGSGDGTARIWYPESGNHQVLKEDSEVLNSEIRSVAISLDDRLLACGTNDGFIRIWDVTTRNLKEKLSGHQLYVFSVAFAPDAKGLISGGLDKNVKRWEIRNHQDELESLSPPASGNRLTTEDDKVEPTDENRPVDGERESSRTMNFTGHKDYVLAVATNPDGRWILSGGRDFSFQFWDSQSGDAHVRVLGHTNSVTSIDVSPLDGYFATGSGDGNAIIWQYAYLP